MSDIKAVQIASVLGLFCVFAMPAALAQTVVEKQAAGTVSLVKGVVTANSTAHGLRTLDKGSEVFEQDEIETAQDSFVVVVMNDQGKLTLRPKTRLLVQAYRQQAGQETARLKLIKGGLRAITGLIGKRKPQAVKLETRTTTIGIRGTDFVAIDCRPDAGGNDCALSEQRLNKHSRQLPTRKRDQKIMPSVQEFKGTVPRRIVEREAVGEIKDAVYFAVYDGQIYAVTGNERIELEAVDACFRGEDSGVGGDEFRCLLEIPRFLLHDEFLNALRDEFTLYNIFNQLEDSEAMCQLQW